MHRQDCRNLINFRKHPEKWINVSWEDGIEREFSSHIEVEAVNKTGVLAEVAATIADGGSNIEEVSVSDRQDGSTDLNFTVNVRDRTHLASIMRSVKNMHNVIRVSREST